MIGIIGSFGYFNISFSADFYLYYTNLSNYICFAVILISLVKTIKNFKNEQYGLDETCPKFKFMSLIMILVTCLVYNMLLSKDKTAVEYLFSITNLIMHLLLPIMFTLDWVLFSKHGKIKWYYPLLSLIMPLIYVALILLRALILGNNYTGLLYPYFFLNVAKLGIGGVLLWVAVLVAIFLVMGYAIVGFDRLKAFKKIDNKNKE